MNFTQSFLHNIKIRHSISWSLLALILIGAAMGIGKATQHVDYIWQWNRIPRYILFKEKLEIISDEAAFVTGVSRVGKNSLITVRTDDGPVKTYEIPNGNPEVDKGDEVNPGDVLGFTSKWRAGILIVGLWVTLKLSCASIVLAIFIGLFTGLARISSSPAPKWIAIGYIELIRGTPLLVQIYIFYYFIGQIFSLSNQMAAILALSFFAGAYVAEIVRAGIQSIHRGQMEAARSLGMGYHQAMRYIILPQALKRIMPPLAGQFISLIKDSSLVSIIAITDLTKAGREIATSTFSPFEAFFTVAALYLILTFTLSMFVQYLERRFAGGD